ncbi:Zinc uptake regulation protein [Methylococcus capsulatus]|uniref:Zinc uptake regulation protein n=1 Tax=Methylococcus capsulatus TaxID=414 RepID=A0AA35XU33_METCP|nr:transcriptional repressor [Methylococcus capsulatus]CAI8837784.1 Zinc uptake regulation protein [Methylococcus capsulatus]
MSLGGTPGAEAVALAPSGGHDHQGCIDRALSRAEKLCSERGVRFTPLRRQVLALIWENHEAVKAYDLLELLKPFDPSAKPATVYRALDFLLEQGFIHRVESLNAFIGCSDVGRQHELLLLICDRCHTVEERAASSVMAAVAAEIASAGFRVRYKALEIHGICTACAAREDSV